MNGLPPLEAADRPGEHLWAFVGAIAVADPERPFANPPVAGEVGGFGCFKCDRSYSRRLARKPCHGSLTVSS